MKSMIKTLICLVFMMVAVAGSNNAFGQDEPYYVFVVFETTVTKSGVETSDANPEERRFYVSNVVDVPSRDRSLLRKASKSADEYFVAAVSGPLQRSKGIEHKYYDDAIRINNGVVYDLKSREEVEELQKKVIEELKERNANLFTFTWVYGDTTKGLETSNPTLIRHAPEQPMYGVAAPKAAPKQKAPLKKNR